MRFKENVTAAAAAAAAAAAEHSASRAPRMPMEFGILRQESGKETFDDFLADRRTKAAVGRRWNSGPCRSSARNPPLVTSPTDGRVMDDSPEADEATVLPFATRATIAAADDADGGVVVGPSGGRMD